MKEATITNCIDIHGKEYRMEELSEEKRKQIAMLCRIALWRWQDTEERCVTNEKERYSPGAPAPGS